MRGWFYSLVAFLCCLTLSASAARAERKPETGWIQSEVRLNLRTGAGIDYRIVGTVVSGDAVRVLEKRENWTRVQTSDGKTGWIPAGYLQNTPPAAQRVPLLEDENRELKERLAKIESELTTLKSETAEIHARDAAQRAQLETLTTENQRLRTERSLPLLLAGAGIFVTGMLCLALLRWIFKGRSSSRIRI